MRKALFFLSLIGCFCAPAMGAKDDSVKRVESIVFNLGAHTEFYDNIQNDASGGVRKFDFASTIGSGISVPFPDSPWRFLPEFNWVLPRQAGNSSKIIKNLFMFRADVGYDPLEWLRLRVGTSIMLLNQQGRGGTANINNGTGTSDFYYPDENRSSMNNTFDLGVEALYQEWALRLQTYTYSLFAPESRQYSYSLFVSYYWKQ